MPAAAWEYPLKSLQWANVELGHNESSITPPINYGISFNVVQIQALGSSPNSPLSTRYTVSYSLKMRATRSEMKR
jgi:hypothetical protein